MKKAEEIELGISITLFVKGLIVEGTIISEKKFHEHIIKTMPSGEPHVTRLLIS